MNFESFVHWHGGSKNHSLKHFKTISKLTRERPNRGLNSGHVANCVFYAVASGSNESINRRQTMQQSSMQSMQGHAGTAQLLKMFSGVLTLVACQK